MDVLILTLFVSLILVLGALIFLVHRVKAGDVDHGDRLALLPLDSDDPGGVSTGTPSDRGLET